MGWWRHGIGPIGATALSALAGVSFITVRAFADRGAVRMNDAGEVSLEVNFRYPPTAADILHLKSQLDRAQLVLCDATDERVKLTNVKITGGEAAQNSGDLWLLPNQARSFAGDHVTLYNGAVNGHVISHELGHYLLGMLDSYPENRRVDGCGIGRSFDPEVRLDSQWNSLMQEAQGQVCRDASGLGVYEHDPDHFFDVACYDDADCRGACPACGVVFTCPNPDLSSELSIASNNDLLTGEGLACPAPRPTSILVIEGYLNPDEGMAWPQDGGHSKECGNGQADAGEFCDGWDLEGEDCISLGYPGGTLRCADNCGFDTSFCTAPATCSNIDLGDDECARQDPFPPYIPSEVTCSSLGFPGVNSGDRSLLDCHPNCTLDTSRCPGRIISFDPSSLDTMLATSNAHETVEVIDELGRVVGNAARLEGQSSHELHVFAEHWSPDQWILYFASRDQEYEGGVAGGLRPIDEVSLGFSGNVLTSVDGGAPTESVTLELGGSQTGGFVVGDDGQRAAPLVIELRLSDLIQGHWTDQFGYSGSSKLELRAYGGEPGTPEELHLGVCSDDAWCQAAWNPTTGHFEGTDQTIWNGGPISDWDLLSQRVHELYGVTVIPRTTVPEATEPTVSDCGGPINYTDAIAATTQVYMVLDRSGSMELEANVPWGAPQTRLEYAQSAARAFVALQRNQGTEVGLITSWRGRCQGHTYASPTRARHRAVGFQSRADVFGCVDSLHA